MSSEIGFQGLEPTSFCDWPGTITSVVYIGSQNKNVPGCNLKCPTCHNKSLSWKPIDNANIPDHEILERLISRQKFINKVTFTGGEPTLYQNLPNIIRQLKQHDFEICVHTNGFNTLMFETIRKDVDLFCVDIKGPFEKYPKLIGIDFPVDKIRTKIASIIKAAQNNPTQFYFRITKVPSLTNDDLKETIEWVNSFGFRLHLQEYREPKD